MKLRKQGLWVIITVAVAGCAQTTVQPEQETSMANLPRPSVVLVHKFSVNMREVTDIQGL